MSVLWQLVAGLQCGLAYSDDTPESGAVHRRLSSTLPLSYPGPPLPTSPCPIFLIFGSPLAVRRPVFELPQGPVHKIVLVTWQRPSENDVYAITNYFHRTTFLWISEYGGGGENYLSYERSHNVLEKINASEAVNIFKPKGRMEKLPHFKFKKYFTIAANNYSIYTQLARPDKRGYFHWGSGFELKTLFYICRAIGLLPVITMVRSWDTFHPNGSMKTPGLQDEVRHWTVDAAISGIWYNPSLVGEVEMLQPWEQGCFRYLVPRAARKKFNWCLLIDVFKYLVWLFICLLVLAVTVLLVLFTKLSRNRNVREDGSTLHRSLFTVYSVLLQVSLTERGWSGPQAPILYCWVWTALILAAAFGGSLNAVLVRPELEDKANTIQEFLDRDYTYGASYLPEEDGPIFEDNDSELWRKWKFERFRKENSLQDRIDRMKTRKYVVPGESIDKIFYFLEAPIPPDEVIIHFEVADNCHQWFFSGPIFPLGSPYSEAINKVASRLRSGGVLSAYAYRRLMSDFRLRKFIPFTVFTPTQGLQNNFYPLDFGILVVPFVILAVGYSIAICCFLAELFLDRLG